MLNTHRRMLNLIKRLSGSETVTLEYDGGQGTIEIRSYPRIPEHRVNIPDNLVGESYAIIKALCLDGYLTIQSENPHTRIISFNLTQRGLHRVETALDDVKPKIVWSILVPITVSVVASILTTLVIRALV